MVFSTLYLKFTRYTGLFSLGAGMLLLASCSLSKQVSRYAATNLLKDSAISSCQVGISIYDPAAGKYLYNHDATKYFVPASNTKLFTLYAGLRYVGDSLPGVRYEVKDNEHLLIQPTGDPTFLQSEFASQPVFSFLQGFKKITLVNSSFKDDFLGMGWSWNDYKESYMTQRSNFPVYGNLIRIKVGDTLTITPPTQPFKLAENVNPRDGFGVYKNWADNFLTITAGEHKRLSVPLTPNLPDIIRMLQDTLHATILMGADSSPTFKNTLFSQSADSLYKPMMHRSDNFYAEQTLLMASNELLGIMDDEKIIDTLLSTDLKDIPQRPIWVDGSGLSRYNLFTPQSFVYLLNKMKDEFGLERLKNILPTGGEGTLAAYYKKDSGYIFAKTGTLSNHCALSGFIVTRRNKLLIFSVLANNYITGATPVRRAVEKFLSALRENY